MFIERRCVLNMITSSLLGTYILAFVFGILVSITVFKIFISEDTMTYLVKQAFISVLNDEIEELERSDNND